VLPISTFNPALLGLRFAVEQRNGRQVISVSSATPINEPFVDMLLELSWANGRLVREYTFLLDPADMRTAQAPQVAAPVDVSRNVAQAGAPVRTAPAPAPAPAAAAPSAPPAPPAPPAQKPRPQPEQRPAPAPRESAPADSEYRVKSGDTLSRIASEYKPAEVSLDMMLVALYRANPDAFSGNNMNRLKSGTILTVPTADEVRGGASRGEARGVVVAHAADFNAYRAKLAGQVEASTPAKEAEPAQSAAGKITAKVQEKPNAVNEAKDQLKLSKAGEKAGKAGKTAAVEDKIASDQQAAEAAARVKELEKNVNQLEKLMAVKNKSGAAAQNKVPEMDVAGQPVNAPPAPPKKSAVPAPSPIEQPTLMDKLMDNVQLIGVGLAALLAAVALFLSRRRKAQLVLPKHETSILGDPGTQAPSMFAETGGQNIDTSNSVFNSNFAPSASQLDTNEVDPVAEADVYIAYGRDAQAEEILKEALRTHPERNAVRLKLLEIYANRKDTRTFEMQASELYSQTKGQGDDWAQAAALGLSIDPQNPLYASAAQAAGGFGAVAAVGAAAFAAEEDAKLADFASEETAVPAPDAVNMDLAAEPPVAAAAPADNLMDFSFDDDATALPAPAAAEEPKPADDNVLDFDLGGLGFDAPAPTAAPTEPPAASAPNAMDLAFDMDFNAPATEPPAPAPVAAAEPSPLDDLGMDFNLDLPGDENPTEAPAPAPADPLAELDMMDFALPGAPAAEAPAPAAAAPELTADDFKLDLPGDDTPAAAPAPAAQEFDLSGIDLNLDTAQPAAEAYAPAPAMAEAELSAHHMEMDTKLDLAIAYQEIGDKEGARELLEEVTRGGSDAQVARANQMKALLG
jgi:pilus assembly protein FimV